MVLAKNPLKEIKYTIRVHKRYVRWEKKVAFKERVVEFFGGILRFLLFRLELFEAGMKAGHEIERKKKHGELLETLKKRPKIAPE